MRNLKKVLTLVLTVAMLLSVMVVGTGAAFSDQSSIKNTEAVDVCSALNIIGGFPDGSYRPTNNVTRAEMCKMICVALNGGTEPNLGTNNVPTFNDVRGTSGGWAESYIESCYSLGIVSGVGEGRFNPNGSITGTQAARMLLVALGYNATNEAFTGNSWAVNVNVRATQKSLYSGIESIDTNAALTRDNAAQMIWNALEANMVTYKNEFTTGANGQIIATPVLADKQGVNGNVTLLEDKYNTTEDVGVMTASGELSISGTNPGEDKFDVGGTTFEKEGSNFSDLIGQEVKVIHKTIRDKDVVFGVFATGKNTVQTGIVDDLDDVTMTGTAPNKTVTGLKLDGKTLKLEADFEVYAKSGPEGQYKDITNDLDTQANAFAIKIIDNDDNGRYDVALIDTKLIGQVTSSNAKTFTIKQVGATTTNVAYNGSNTLKFDYDDEDITNPTVYNDIAKDDFVVCSYDAVTGALIVEKANTVSQAEISTINNGKFTVDGSVYKTATADAKTTGLTVGDKADFVVYGNYIYTCDEVNSTVSASDYVVVLGSKTGDELSDNQVKILKTDGTTDIVTAKNDNSGTAADVNGDALTRYAVYTTSTSGSKVKFTPASDKGAFDVKLANTTFAYNSDNNSRTTLGGSRIADNAIILYLDKDGDPQMMTGSTLRGTKALGSITHGSGAAGWANTESNGVDYVQFAWLGQLGGVKSGADKTVYAYVVDTCGTTKDGDDTVSTITVASGDGESTVLVCDDTFAGASVTKPNKGDFIKYDLNNDGKVDTETVAVLTVSSATTFAQNTLFAVAITGREDKSIYATLDVAGTGITEFVTDADTQIVYVNVNDKEGGADVGITQAGKNEAGYIKNAYVYYEDDDSDKLIKVIFVESDNDITG